MNKVEKITVEAYHIGAGYSGWGIITIDDECNLSINSDWGTWSYRWHKGALGSPTFKHFLLRIGKGYLGNKLLGNDLYVFDSNKTRAQLMSDILEYRREGRLDSEESREFYVHAKKMGGDKETDFYEWHDYNSSIDDTIQKMIDTMYDDILEAPLKTRMSYHYEEFYKKNWTPFLEFIKKEVEEDNQ